MNLRPAIFEAMGEHFTAAFSNAEAEFTIAGTRRPAVRCILRQWRDADLVEAEGQAVEGTSHLLSVSSGAVAGLVSQRDRVDLYPLDALGARTGDVIACAIRNHADDGRAMTKIWLEGNL